jgi:exopolyphosphatase/guanosine-5'-triphosphate,3'-diphosphate pyrophosphatase
VTTIVPRWEWRAFGRSFGGAEDALVPITPTRTEEATSSTSSPGPGANVKVRDDLMDVKVLREVNADGLERWEPVMKQGFPLATADVSEVLEALDVPAPQLTRAAYTLDAFLNELIRPNDLARVVNVHKRRNRFTVAGCMAELADVVADGRPTRTLAVESEDADAGHRRRPCHRPRRLREHELSRGGSPALIDGEPARSAVIDVGTNSVKFHIGERDGSGIGTPSSTEPRSHAWVRGSTSGARSGARRSNERWRRSRRCSRRPNETVLGPSPRWAPRVCARHATGTTCSPRSASAPASASR